MNTTHRMTTRQRALATAWASVSAALLLAAPMAMAQSGYTVSTLDGVHAPYSVGQRLDNTNRAWGNRSRYTLQDPPPLLTPFGGYVPRSAYWSASTSSKVSPTSQFWLASEWSTDAVSDNGQWQGLVSTVNGNVARGQGGKVIRADASQVNVNDHVLRDINNQGDMVGHTYRSSSAQPVQPYLWRNGVAQRMSVGTALGGQANTINNLGEVAGSVWLAPLPGASATDYVTRAAKWQNGVVTWVADPAVFGDRSNVIAMNDAGTMLVSSYTTGGGAYATYRVVTASGQVTTLSTQPGVVWAYDINASGVVVGETANRAVFWVNGVAVDLASHLAAKGVSGISGWQLLSVLDINDKGSMVVRYRVASDTNGNYRNVRFTAKP